MLYGVYCIAMTSNERAIVRVCRRMGAYIYVPMYKYLSLSVHSSQLSMLIHIIR